MNPDNGKVLVDTSAWIAAFRGEGEAQVQEFLKQKIAAGQVVISPPIILELVQGCKTARERDRLLRELESLELLEISDHIWELAYGLAFDFRRKGLTLPTMDIVIIAIAMEHRCLLLHLDRHFSMAGKHVKALRLMALGSL